MNVKKNILCPLTMIVCSLSVDIIRTRLGLKTEKFTVTVEVKASKFTEEIYITGNQRALGDWNPEKTNMIATSDSTRMITFETYGDLKFKITGGSWEKEKKLKGFEKGKDIMLVVRKVDIYHFEIDQKLRLIPKSIYLGVFGSKKYNYQKIITELLRGSN
jgi:hypothetical protein